jgi:hypothetical protein
LNITKPSAPTEILIFHVITLRNYQYYSTTQNTLIGKKDDITLHVLTLEQGTNQVTFQFVGGLFINFAAESKIALAGHIVYPLLRLLFAATTESELSKIISHPAKQPNLWRYLIESED